MYFIAADKHGWQTLKIVEGVLKNIGIDYQNISVDRADEDLKLEEFIPKVTKNVLADRENKGILICGTGIGVNVGANKFGGIRAHLATNEEQARWSRKYDDCNILCLAGWDKDEALTKKIIMAWLETEYDGDVERQKMFQVFNTWH